MHDTAYRIGGMVMDTYLPSSSARILEIGALDVNGTLRDHSPRNAEYVGLDFEAGKGVDSVVTSLDDWGVPDGSFDLVIASSVFEHDPSFWKTFIAMCRKAKAGGHVYVSAPSNGTVHRYPKDYWRFYPDAGLALEQAARAEGLELTLVESFVAEREADCWNDFCAIFHVGSVTDNLNRDFIYRKLPVTNVVHWRSSLVIEPVDDPQDVRLLHRSREEGHILRLEGEALREELSGARATFDEERRQLAACEERLRIDHAEQVASLTAQIESLRDELGKMRVTFENERLDHVEQVTSFTMRIETLEAEVKAQVDKKAIAEQRLDERFQEIAGLTRIIQQCEQAMSVERVHAEWLRQVASVLSRGFSTSTKSRLASALPIWFGKRRQKAVLKQKGLFDSTDYIALNPDVAYTGVDPLRHYINHGMVEGRPRSKSNGGSF